MEGTPNQLNFDDVERLLPQGPPVLMIDRVLSYKVGAWIKAVKCVSGLDPYFGGHLRHGPKIVPGLLLVEGMAQCALLLALLAPDRESSGPELTHLLGGVKASFRGVVRPGDVVIFEVELEDISKSRAQFSGISSVDGKVVAKAECFSVGSRVE